ncbi:MAG: glycosyltransferase family 4 protein [Deltaproteobacteria bacterium]|nr:glycosyltransferase family 4 protein [Deltaproteobacteria bacterium]
MTRPVPLTIWIGFPAPYQNDLLEALEATGRVDLHVVFARHLPADRLELGWKARLGSYRHRFLSDGDALSLAARLAWRQRHRVHVVNGIWMEAPFAVALSTLAGAGSRYLIFSESPDARAPRPLPLRITRRALGTAIARAATGALAVSHFALDYYRALGVPERGLYPFGYFCRGADREAVAPHRRPDRLEVLYLGQLVHRKGLDLLLEAIRPLLRQSARLHLAIAGAGPERAELERRVAEVGLAGRVRLEGPVASHEVLGRIAAADLLALPSRWDGWGIVVNEALSVGVPVLISDRCGAMDLVRQGVNGYVHTSESVASLRANLEAFVRLGPAERLHMRQAALQTGEQLRVRRAAEYLIDCVEHALKRRAMPPAIPWLEARASRTRRQSRPDRHPACAGPSAPAP